MRTKLMLVTLALVGFSTAASSAAAQCTVKYRSQVSYDPIHEPVRVLRAKSEIREFLHLGPFITRNPNTITKVKRGKSTDCNPVDVFPECSELEIRSDNGGGALMTLKDTQVSPSKEVITSLPLHPSGAKVDFLSSDELPLDGKKYVLYVYLLNDNPLAGKIDKHYLLEAFDTADKACEQFRPDTHPDQIADKNPKSKPKSMQPQETDTTDGHEGHN
jgi:hypothetical protein